MRVLTALGLSIPAVRADSRAILRRPIRSRGCGILAISPPSRCRGLGLRRKHARKYRVRGHGCGRRWRRSFPAIRADCDCLGSLKSFSDGLPVIAVRAILSRPSETRAELQSTRLRGSTAARKTICKRDSRSSTDSFFTIFFRIFAQAVENNRCAFAFAKQAFFAAAAGAAVAEGKAAAGFIAETVFNHFFV